MLIAPKQSCIIFHNPQYRDDVTSGIQTQLRPERWDHFPIEKGLLTGSNVGTTLTRSESVLFIRSLREEEASRGKSACTPHSLMYSTSEESEFFRFCMTCPRQGRPICSHVLFNPYIMTTAPPHMMTEPAPGNEAESSSQARCYLPACYLVVSLLR